MYKNHEMERMLGTLEKHLDRCDMIGYAAARNTRILRDELTEYFDKRSELVIKYGEPQLDEEGNPTGNVGILFGTEAFEAFIDELKPFSEIVHYPELFKLKYEEAIGNLSGTELLEIDWMFEE